MKRMEKIMFQCVSCKRKEYINPRSTNAIIVENEKGEILIAKRKYNPGKGLWDLLGGFVNPGETIEQSVKREFKEETGINLSEIEYFGSYSDNYFYQKELLPIVVICFVGKMKKGKLKAGDDVSELFFVSKEKINFKKIAFPSSRRFVKDYLKIKNKKSCISKK